MLFIYIYVCAYKYVILLWLYFWSKSSWWTSVYVAFSSKAQGGKGHHEQPLNTLQTETTSSVWMKITWTLINLLMNRIQLDTALKHWNYLYCRMWSIPLLTMFSLCKYRKSQYLIDHHISKLLQELHSLPSTGEAASWSIFLTQAAGNCQQVTALMFWPSRKSDLTALQMVQMSNWHHLKSSFWVWKETDLHCNTQKQFCQHPLHDQPVGWAISQPSGCMNSKAL